MNAKKYVSIIISTAVLFITAVYLLTLFLPEIRYMDEEYPYWIQQRDYITTKGTQQEILLLGDSRMKIGALATELGGNVYNLSLGGASPVEMYYTLKTYLAHRPLPKAVIIGFAPTHYTQMYNSYTGRNLYFHYFDDETAEAVNRVIYEKDGKDFSAESKLYKYRLPNVYMKPVIKSIFKPRLKENRSLYERTGKEKGRLFSHDDNKERKFVFTPESNDKGFKPLNSLTYYTEGLLQLCQENAIPIYIEQLPMGNPGYQKLKDNGYFTDYKAYLKALYDKYPATIINYEVPLYEAQYFQDDSHLNIKGSKKFSRELKEKYPQVFGK